MDDARLRPARAAELRSVSTEDGVNSPVKLRPYQTATLRAIAANFLTRGINRQLVVLPTGTGKTVIFANLLRLPQIQRWLNTYPPSHRKVLVIAHRDELLSQARQKFRTTVPSWRIGVEKAARHATPHSNVVIASIQTLAATQARRLLRFSLDEFRIVIVDEAHHAPASTYRKVLRLLGFAEPPPTEERLRERLLLGVTATSRRTDGIGLGSVFDEVVFERTLPEMVAGGYLCPLRGLQISTQVNLDSVRRIAGDFHTAELAEAINVEERNRLIVKSWSENCQFARKTLAFCADVQHAMRLADCFNRHGVVAAALSGKDAPERRREVLRQFSNGEIRILANCNLFTEGFDEPGIDCVLLARPTQSQLLYVQMIGRGTRVAPGKAECLIVDYVDVSTRFPLVTLADLNGIEPPTEVNRLDEPDPESVFADERVTEEAITRARPLADLHTAATPVELLLHSVQTTARLLDTEFAWLYDARLNIFHISFIDRAGYHGVYIRQLASGFELLDDNQRTVRTFGRYPTLIAAQQQAEALLRAAGASERGRFVDACSETRDNRPRGGVYFLRKHCGIVLSDTEVTEMTQGDVSDLIRHCEWRQYLDRNDRLRIRLGACTKREELLCAALQSVGGHTPVVDKKQRLQIARALIKAAQEKREYLCRRSGIWDPSGGHVRRKLRLLLMDALKDCGYPQDGDDAAIQPLLKLWKLYLDDDWWTAWHDTPVECRTLAAVVKELQPERGQGRGAVLQ